jgi:hypothetical protein
MTMSIEAMKEAIEALKQCASTDNEMELKAIASLRQAIAEAEKQKPVAWRWRMSLVQDRYWQFSEHPHQDALTKEPLYTHPQPAQQKAEGQYALEQALTRLQKRYSELEAKVAAQSNQCANFAQSEWVGLTDEEMQDCLNGLPTQTIDVYARSIEAKLKEKNT